MWSANSYFTAIGNHHICIGSTSPAIVFIKNTVEAQKLQDYASSRCTITYRAPELFHVEVNATIDQRTDIWVNIENIILKCWLSIFFNFHTNGKEISIMKHTNVDILLNFSH